MQTLGQKDYINEKLPVGQLLTLGFQNVLIMYSAAVIVPIIFASAVGLSKEELAFLISADLFTCGIATFLQSYGIGNFIGIRLPVMLGCAVITLGPMISIAKSAGMATMYGAIILSGFAVFLASFFIHKIIKFFPPVVTGSLVVTIGFSLVPFALQDMAGGFGAPNFGDPINYVIAFSVLVFILLVNKFGKGFTKAISILLGLIAGTIVTTMMGIVDYGQVEQAAWFRFVTPFYFGVPNLTLNGLVSMCIFLLISVVESVGIFYMIADLCEVKITPRDIANGIRAESVAQILGGVFNSFPYVTFSENAGLISMTGVKNRHVLTAAAGFLILLGVMPKFAALTTIIPHPVLGGAMLCLFGTIGANGIKILSDVDFKKNENIIIVACAVGFGLGTSVTPGLFDKMPELAKMLLGNGIFTATFIAIILNIFFNYKEIRDCASDDGKDTKGE